MSLLPIVIELWQIFVQFAALLLPEIDGAFLVQRWNFWCAHMFSDKLQVVSWGILIYPIHILPAQCQEKINLVFWKHQEKAVVMNLSIFSTSSLVSYQLWMYPCFEKRLHQQISKPGVLVLLLAFLPPQDLDPKSLMAFLAVSPPANNAKCVLILGHKQSHNLKGIFYSQPLSCICHYFIYIYI